MDPALHIVDSRLEKNEGPPIRVRSEVVHEVIVDGHAPFALAWRKEGVRHRDRWPDRREVIRVLISGGGKSPVWELPVPQYPQEVSCILQLRLS